MLPANGEIQRGCTGRGCTWRGRYMYNNGKERVAKGSPSWLAKFVVDTTPITDETNEY